MGTSELRFVLWRPSRQGDQGLLVGLEPPGPGAQGPTCRARTLPQAGPVLAPGSSILTQRQQRPEGVQMPTGHTSQGGGQGTPGHW